MVKLINPNTFFVDSVCDYDRIDSYYYDPNYFKLIHKLQTASGSSGFRLLQLKQLLKEHVKGSLTGGATPLGAAYLSEGVPFIRVQNVRETGIDLSDVVYISRRIHEGDLKRSQLAPKNVLLTITGYTYGIAATVPVSLTEANINQHVVKIVINEDMVIPKYLSMYLNSEYGKKQMDREVTGGTRPALDYDSIRGLQILLPDDILIQARIVNECEKICHDAELKLKEISKLESSCDTIVLDGLEIELPEEPKLKIFSSQIEGQDRLDVNWFYPYINKVMKILKDNNGHKLGNYNHTLKYGASIDADYNSDTSFLRIENLDKNFIDISDVQYISSSVYKDLIPKFGLKEGDILIARSGSVGLCSHISHLYENYTYGSYMIRLRLNDKRLGPRYLSAYLNSILGRVQFDKLKTGSSQYNINTQHIRNIFVVEPNIDTQEDISHRVFDNIEQIIKLRKDYKELLIKSKCRFIELLNSEVDHNVKSSKQS